MTPTEFFKLRDKIYNSLVNNLEQDRLKKDISSCRASNLKTEKEYFYLEADAEDQHLVLQQVLDFKHKVNGEVTHHIEEQGNGRVGYYYRTAYKVEYKTLIDEISETMLKIQVHKALRGIMGLSKWSTIDCALMQLFKDGKLEWDDLVTAHKTTCTF